MSAAALLLAVVVLSKHRPEQLAIEGCTSEGRSVTALTAKNEAVEACDARRRCRTRARVELTCPGGARVQAPSLEPRTYGKRLFVSNEDGALRVIAEVELEPYVAGVVTSELARAPDEARKAQAIVARTYALAAREKARHRDAHLCDLTHCQVFRELAADAAVATTRGRTLRGGALAPVFFHSTCGGRTEDAHRVWPELSTTELTGVSDLDPQGRAYCEGSPHHRWIHEVGEAELAHALGDLARRRLDPASLELAIAGGRAEIRDRGGRTSVSAARVHLELGRRLGWSTIKSPAFTAERTGRVFRLRGRGLGHQVGLCQHGAIERARRGASAEEILRAYFPRLEIVE